MSQHNEIVVVTGLSGAGMSSALKVLEDIGYEVFDNFPLALIDPLLKDSDNTKSLAIGIDTRTRGFDPDTILKTVHDIKANLLFLTSDEAILQKRFTETRRTHPLATDRPVSAGIRKELEILYSLRESADLVIDTTALNIHDLRRVIDGHFARKETGSLALTLMSFGFKFGVPREADLVMDVRFLKNPHWEKELKDFTGLDPQVGTYIQSDDNFASFIENFKNLIEPLLPRYAHEGKSYLTIAIGCTGGKHRSVFSVETLKPWLEDQGFPVHIKHRDMDR
ncbi:MAG: RNase adapter RapZ [Pseudomonadota bacterium]